MPSLVYTPPASASASASPTASQKSAGSKHTPVGAIVGGVIGGLLALVFIPLIVLWLRRRKADPEENVASPFSLSNEAKPEGTSRSRFLVSQGVLLAEFWSLDSSTPAQLEGQTLSNAIRPSSNGATISPFQNEALPTAAYLSLSAADRKGKRNNIPSGATSRPSPMSSTARSDVTSMSTTNLTSVTSPATDLSSRLSISSPPAYEAVLDRRRSEFPSQ